MSIFINREFAFINLEFAFINTGSVFINRELVFINQEHICMTVGPYTLDGKECMVVRSCL